MADALTPSPSRSRERGIKMLLYLLRRLENAYVKLHIYFGQAVS
jgi:hypothetical protein